MESSGDLVRSICGGGGVTNLEKMNQLVGASATKQEIMDWAYMNREYVDSFAEDEPFHAMRHSAQVFARTSLLRIDERDNWSRFLDAKYVEVTP